MPAVASIRLPLLNRESCAIPRAIRLATTSVSTVFDGGHIAIGLSVELLVSRLSACAVCAVKTNGSTVKFPAMFKMQFDRIAQLIISARGLEAA